MNVFRVGLCVVALAACPVWGERKATMSTEGKSVATQGLLHTVENLYHLPSSSLRAGRIVAACRYLAALAPDDPHAQLVLRDVYHAQRRSPEAAAAARKVMAARKGDYFAAERWMQFQVGLLQSARGRKRFLEEIVKNEAYSPSLRSQAAIQLGSVWMGQGGDKQARAALETACTLAPWNAGALIARLAMTKTPDASTRVKTMLALIKANPRAYWVLRELASQLGELGLHAQALKLYTQSWDIQNPGVEMRNAPPAFAKLYLSALLDAGQGEKGIALFAAAPGRVKDDTECQSLLYEAYRRAGNDALSGRIVKTLKTRYTSLLTQAKVAEGLDAAVTRGEKKPGPLSARAAMNLGWFELLIAEKPLRALRAARLAKEYGASGEGIDLLLAASELRADKTRGEAVLRDLAKAYPVAAVLLAEHDYQAGKKDAGQAAVLMGLKAGRQNVAYRKLRDLATQHGVTIPAPKQQAAVAALVKAFPWAMLDMATKPASFLRLTITPRPTTALPLGTSLLLDATLTNTGPFPIPLGPEGLLEPRIAFVAEVPGGGGQILTNLPFLSLPAPRVLDPGQKVAGQVRLDVGALSRVLAADPLRTFDISLRAILSPRLQEGGMKSDLVGLKPAQASVRRVGLFGVRDPQADPTAQRVTARRHTQVIRRLEAGLYRKKNPPALIKRVQGARAIGAMLVWTQQLDETRTAVPKGVAGPAGVKVLCHLLAQVLRDPSPAVRAEMIASLPPQSLTGPILDVLAYAIEDPSSLVRYRLLESIGASGTSDNKTLVEFFAEDKDPAVRELAQAFLRHWKKQARAKARRK